MQQERKNRKKPMKTWQKLLIFFIAQLAIVLAGLFAFNVVFESRFVINTSDGVHYYTRDPFEEKESFEESEIFENMLESALNDITFLSVIKNQLETNGEFDGKKQVDITDYVYRRDKEEKEDVTAVFYLEDLLKWYKYGLEYTTQEVWIDNLNQEDSPYITITEENIVEVNLATDFQSVSVNAPQDENGYYNPSVWMEQSIDFHTPYCSFSGVSSTEDGRAYGSINVLKCRYQTVDGKNLEELVNNWQDYFTLVHNLDVAIANLAINYDKYQALEEIYGNENTNIRYCIQMVNGDSITYVSNMEQLENSALTAKEIQRAVDGLKAECGKYLYYCPADMSYETNTDVPETIMFNILTGQLIEYAYPETTKIWFGIDTSYPITDDFSVAKKSYEGIRMPAVQLLTFAGVLVIVYIIMMNVLFFKAGWEKDEEGNVSLRLNMFDRTPTEILLVGSGVILFLGLLMWKILLSGISGVYQSYHFAANVVVAGAVFFTFAFLGILMLSLARRIKGHNLLSDTLLVFFLKKIAEKWDKTVSENRGGMVKYWIIYQVYLVVNFILVAFGIMLIDRGGWVLILLAVAFDIWVGYQITRNINERLGIIRGINRIRDGEISHQVDEAQMHGENKGLAEAVNNIGDGIRKAVETSMKDERLKADLITNVSHDIKTPLTSIINYVDLLKREDIENETVRGYIEVLDAKSQRLKQLTEDLVEASKISSGNISYVYEKINLIELVNQALGEFDEKFASKQLQVVDNLAGQSAFIEADSRRMWRIIENLFNNIYKYALEGTRVYLMLQLETIGQKDYVTLSLKNISSQPLNINADELTERFIRGDVSRSTEGSGLGLSIAKNLTEAQHGKFDIYLDGDLFKVTIQFEMMSE